MPTDSEMASRERLSCDIEITPAFYDIDVMEIVYHGNYVRFLDLARSALRPWLIGCVAPCEPDRLDGRPWL